MSRAFILHHGGSSGGGGSLNLICEPALPSEVEERTIVAIAPDYRDIILGSVEPDPEEGLIWIRAANTSPFRMSFDGSMEMTLLSAQIYEDGKWQRIPAYHSFLNEWVSFALITLQDTPWSAIAAISEAGFASDYFQIGDEKRINLTAPIGLGEPITFRIEDFNHDNLVSGGKAGISFGMRNLLETKYQMNSTDTKAGGYKSSIMRSTHIPAILAKLPADLKAVIKPVIKKGIDGGSPAAIQTTEELLWLFASIELGDAPTTHNLMGAEGEAYPLFVDNKSRIKYLSDGAGVNESYWTRTPGALSPTTAWFYANTSGNLGGGGDAKTAMGVCLGACI